MSCENTKLRLGVTMNGFFVAGEDGWCSNKWCDCGDALSMTRHSLIGVDVDDPLMTVLIDYLFTPQHVLHSRPNSLRARVSASLDLLLG